MAISSSSDDATPNDPLPLFSLPVVPVMLADYTPSRPTPLLGTSWSVPRHANYDDVRWYEGGALDYTTIAGPISANLPRGTAVFEFAPARLAAEVSGRCCPPLDSSCPSASRATRMRSEARRAARRPG